ncbi:MAG: PEGA domain-containing protein, partial [Patescibacteria group bacterium]|nr:PEGA domain-containing protein [Patescibacteria group bacterium]
MKPLSLKKRRFYFYTLLAVFFIIIPVVTLYTSGYRIGKGFQLVETGGIYIYSPEAGADIYVDNKKKKTTNIFQKELFLQDLTPGTYVVYITKDGFWPWLKEVEVEERKVTTTIAFLVPKEPKGEVIPRILSSDPALSTTTPTTEGKLNPEYMDVVDLFQKHEAEKRRIFALA